MVVFLIVICEYSYKPLERIISAVVLFLVIEFVLIAIGISKKKKLNRRKVTQSLNKTVASDSVNNQPDTNIRTVEDLKKWLTS